MKLIIIVWLGLLLAACSSSGGKSGDAQQEHVVDAQASARIRTELAAVYYGLKQYAVALDELKLALNMNSKYAPAYGVRGLVYMALKEDSKAEEDFERSLDLDSKDSGTRNNFGWFLCQRCPVWPAHIGIGAHLACGSAWASTPLRKTSCKVFWKALVCGQPK